MSDSGSLSAGQRIERLEQNVEAIERDCEGAHGKIWREMDSMKAKAAATDIAVQAQIAQVKQDQAVASAKLVLIVSIATFVLGCGSQYVMKRLDRDEKQAVQQQKGATP